jgi:hypothetical protein
MSYTGREVLQAAAAITKDDFEVIAWLTGECCQLLSLLQQ